MYFHCPDGLGRFPLKGIVSVIVDALFAVSLIKRVVYTSKLGTYFISSY